MRVYVVDNGGQWTHREWRVLRDLGVDTKIIPNDTPLDEFDVDGLVLSGGAARIGWESPKLGKTGEYLDKVKVPILGICVGHQYMALHFGGTAGPAETAEYGTMDLVIDDADDLFTGLPDEFRVWMSHNDEIKTLPKDFRILAHSPTCSVQAIKFQSRPLYGVQFHPEVEHTEHGEEIFRNFLSICKS